MMNISNVKIRKNSGEIELFQVEKLCRSISAVGVSDDMAQQVCDIVAEHMNTGVSTTEQIFRTTREYIAKVDPGKAAIYGLERGLSALGPSGFLFEQYVAAILLDLGYKVQTNVYLDGEGVTHEIDVYAEKGNVIYVIEAKYRNEFKSKTHINQVMYADARLDDIRRQAKKRGDTREYYMWLVTNTRFTDNAINYIQYRDIQLMGWDFPKYINLMKVAYEKKLFPVTVLPSITLKALKTFSAQKIILVKDLVSFSEYQLRDIFGFSLSLSKKLHQEIIELMK